MFKRLLRLMLMVGLPLILLLVGYRFWVVHELEKRSQEIGELSRLAQATTQESRDFLHAGDFEMAALVPESVIIALLRELEGYSQITSKGNLFRVNRTFVTFHDGYVDLKAEADFKWRFGFYDGPIDITYRGFARADEQGQCHLDLRVTDTVPKATLPGLNSWLAPLVTLRLQNKLKIPHIALPISYGQSINLPAMNRETEQSLVSMPARSLTLSDEKSMIFCSEHAIGIVVKSKGQGLAEGMFSLTDQSDFVTVAMRADYLNRLLASYVASSSDLVVDVARMPKVWQKQSKILGKTFENSVDIVGLVGSIDVQTAEIFFEPNEILFNLSATSRMTGHLDANMIGIKTQVPFTVDSDLESQLLPLVYDELTKSVRFQPTEIQIPMWIEVPVLQHTIAFSHQLTINPADLVRAFTLPDVMQTNVSIPTRVEKRQIIARKEVTLDVDWHLTLPQDHHGFVVANGDVSIVADSTPK